MLDSSIRNVLDQTPQSTPTHVYSATKRSRSQSLAQCNHIALHQDGGNAQAEGQTALAEGPTDQREGQTNHAGPGETLPDA